MLEPIGPAGRAAWIVKKVASSPGRCSAEARTLEETAGRISFSIPG